MSTTTPQSDVANISFWRKSGNWLRAFEDAMDFDPTQASVDRLNHQVNELKGAVSKLQSQLSARNEQPF